jgi:hypothetical protein
MMDTVVILHNPHSKASREFVAAYGAGYQVVDWYSTDAQTVAYKSKSLPSPRAFPSVVDTEQKLIVDIPGTMQECLDYFDSYTPEEEEIPAYLLEVTVAELRDPDEYDKWIRISKVWAGVEHIFWCHGTEQMVELYEAEGLAVDDTVLLDFVERDRNRRVVVGKLHGSFS